MNSKLIGGTLLIVGTTIGAGVLALPAATAQLGFWASVGLLVGCWLIMTTCAFLFLEVNLRLPPNTNMISMVGVTLGWPAKVIAWVAYMVLLYSILSAYIASGGDMFHYLLTRVGLDVPQAVASVLFTAIFGVIVYLGIRAVDYVNRGLMFAKMGSFLLLIIIILPFIAMGNLSSGAISRAGFPTSLSVTVVAFTCLMIIPSLRGYFGEDVASLRKAILYGTIIPLVCYIAWDAVIMGVIPLDGVPGLREMKDSSNTTSQLVLALTGLLQKNSVTALANFFTPICVTTSFLSVALSLSDVLSDGMRVTKAGMGNLLVFGATFLPPILVVLVYPNAFIQGLHFAGLCCFILMVFFPPLMVWSVRYFQPLETTSGLQYQVAGGKYLLGFLIVFGALMIGVGIQDLLVSL